MHQLLGTHATIPSLAGLQQLLAERHERRTLNGRPWIKTKNLLFQDAYISHGVSEFHYRFYARLQFLNLYQKKWDIRFEGLEHIPKNEAVLYVMKHRGYADITLHGIGSLWATSQVPLNTPEKHLWQNPELFLDLISSGQICRFVMKDELLCLPIGYHLVINGGIPVPQDLETKAKNSTNFKADDPKALARQKELGQWFHFKDSFREILSSLKKQQSMMIYGEATRVHGDQMGHLSTKLIQKLSRATKIIPVGSVLKGRELTLKYGPVTQLEQLRDTIAELSEIPPNRYIP
jgi:1-acyl-sn-glycerol-3-phosphate acyltransferase